MHLLVPVGLILCDVVSVARDDCSVERFYLAAGLQVIGGVVKCLVPKSEISAAKSSRGIEVRNWSVVKPVYRLE